MPEPTFQRAPRRSSGARIAAIVAAAVIGLLSLGLFAAGGVMLWGDAQRDDQGFVSTGVDRFATGTYALASDDLDVAAGAPDWLVGRNGLGRVRLTIAPRAGKDVFVGIARARDVSAYLRRSAHASVRDVSYSPFSVAARRHDGERPPGPPGRRRFWAASAQGAETQAITWRLRPGSWSVVVMNADGSPGIDAGLSAGAKVSFLGPAGWSFLGGGLILLVLAGGLLFLGVRPPRGPRTDPGPGPRTDPGPIGAIPAVPA